MVFPYWRHRYVPRLFRLLLANRTRLRKGLIQHILVQHDSWCHALSKRGPCNCDPDVRIVATEDVGNGA